MRYGSQEETIKIVSNFYVMIDGAPQPAQLQLTFASKDMAAEFWDTFERAKRLERPRVLPTRVMWNHYKTSIGK